jgi:undecaprenyl-diphosphatase
MSIEIPSAFDPEPATHRDARVTGKRTGQPSAAIVAAVLVVAGSVIVAATLALLVHHGAGFTRVDRRGLHLFRRHDTPLVADAAHALADLGTIQTLVVLAILIGVVMRACRLHPVLCAVPLASLLITGGFVQLLKVTIPRASPNTAFRFGPTVGASFPSGHAADTTALAIGVAIVLGAVVLRRPAERVLVFVAAGAISVAVGLSRLVIGVHWPTDVLAGWAIGLGTAVVVATVAVLATRAHPIVTDRA